MFFLYFPNFSQIEKKRINNKTKRERIKKEFNKEAEATDLKPINLGWSKHTKMGSIKTKMANKNRV